MPSTRVPPSPLSLARVIALRCEHLDNPLGLDETAPRFSWQMRDSRQGARQSAYELAVSSISDFPPGQADMWSSGRVRGNDSQLITYAGKKLRPHTRYFWRVRIWDHLEQVTPWSEPATWTTGFLGTRWPAAWIGLPVRARHLSTPVRYLRCNFDLTATPVTAHLYITALGNFEAHLNGARIGLDVLAPGWTDYRRRTEYLTYDVTDLLVPGRNALAVLLADGWYCGRLGWHGQRRIYGPSPALLATLRVTLPGGTVRTIATGPKWKATTGAFLSADLYDGEVFDARREQHAWTAIDFDDTSWRRASVIAVPPIAIDAKQTPPIRAIERVPARVLIEPQRGRFVFDFNQNLVGVVCLRVTAPAGTRVQIRHGEMLNADGTLYTANLRSAAATDVYICRGGGLETYTPRFTFHGFRYIELSGLPDRPALDSVEGIVLHSDLRPTGSFTCSDRLINRLQHNIRWGQRGNYVDLPTDCPQRDERMGWTGDAQIFVGTAAFNYDIASFFRKWLRDLRDGQHRDGSIPDVAPDAIACAMKENPSVWPPHRHDGNAAWGDAIVVCPWVIYQRYGDLRVLQENYGAMKRWIQFQLRTSNDLIRPDTSYGDWLATDAVTPARAPTPNDLVGTAYFAYGAGLVATIARLLGHEGEAQSLAALQRRIIASFRREYVATSGRLAGDTQTGYLLALAFDLLPVSLRPNAVKRLVHLIERNGDRLATGFVGTPLLCPVLSRFGRDDVAFRLLFQEAYPSWLYPVRNGATTMWERWNSWTRETGFGDVGMNSFNHYAYGAVGEWLYETVAGIAPDPRWPAFKRIRLRPALTTRLTRVEARLDSPYGEIRSTWRLQGSRLKWEILIPPNTQAITCLPTRHTSGIRIDGQTPSRSILKRTETGCEIILPAGRYTIELAGADVIRGSASA